MACNYDASATDAGYCDFADSGYDCDGACLNDADQDGVCDEFEVAGCTTPRACNFLSNATESDGSCTFADAGYDCDGNCLVDLDNDGECDLNQTVGCLDTTACNYDVTQRTQVTAIMRTRVTTVMALALNDTDQDGICDEFEVAGCTDNTACNFSNAATDDDGLMQLC